MPQWCDKLESVVITDREQCISEWSARVPWALHRLMHAVNLEHIVRWTAAHETQSFESLSWTTLSSWRDIVDTEGTATFADTGRGVTVLSLRASFTLPGFVAPVGSLLRAIVQRELQSMLENFKRALETEARAGAEEASDPLADDNVAEGQAVIATVGMSSRCDEPELPNVLI